MRKRDIVVWVGGFALVSAFAGATLLRPSSDVPFRSRFDPTGTKALENLIITRKNIAHLEELLRFMELDPAYDGGKRRIDGAWKSLSKELRVQWRLEAALDERSRQRGWPILEKRPPTLPTSAPLFPTVQVLAPRGAEYSRMGEDLRTADRLQENIRFTKRTLFDLSLYSLRIAAPPRDHGSDAAMAEAERRIAAGRRDLEYLKAELGATRTRLRTSGNDPEYLLRPARPLPSPVLKTDASG